MGFLNGNARHFHFWPLYSFVVPTAHDVGVRAVLYPPPGRVSPSQGPIERSCHEIIGIQYKYL